MDQSRPPSGAAEPAADAEPLRYLCVPGAAYTGSTLLGFLLNTHPACASIGAATGLVAGIDLETYECSCGERFVDCPFWREVARRTRELGHPVDVYRTGMWETHFAPTGRRYLDALLIRSLRSTPVNALRDGIVGRIPGVRGRIRESAERSRALARAVLDQSGGSVFVDTARDHLRPKLLATSPRLDVRVVHLVRDARANVASTMKRSRATAEQGARIWRRANLEADRNRRYLPPERWLRIRYHELCRDVQGTMDRIADFLEIPRAPVPEDFRCVPHHIAGNPMRLRQDGSVREDTSWQERLSQDDLRAIERVAGPANRYFGFDWPA